MHSSVLYVHHSWNCHSHLIGAGSTIDYTCQNASLSAHTVAYSMSIAPSTYNLH